MADWKSIRIIKPLRMFDIKLNEEFSILQLTGVKFKNPYIIYCYKELISNEFTFNSELELVKISEDRFKLIPKDINISLDSKITVLVIESDENILINTELNYSSKYKDIEVISTKYNRYAYIELNKENDYTFDINELKLKDDMFKFMVFTSKMIYLPCCYYIKYTLEKINNTKYKLHLYQKYCDTLNISSTLSTNQVTLNNVGSVSFEFYYSGSHSDSQNYFKITENSKMYLSRMLGFHSINNRNQSVHYVPEFFINSKNKAITLKINSLVGGNYKYSYRYFTPSDNFQELTDFNCQLFILGDNI